MSMSWINTVDGSHLAREATKTLKQATKTLKQAESALSSFECLARACVKVMEDEAKRRRQ